MNNPKCGFFASVWWCSPAHIYGFLINVAGLSRTSNHKSGAGATERHMGGKWGGRVTETKRMARRSGGRVHALYTVLHACACVGCGTVFSVVIARVHTTGD